jgi:hypothetical protein
MAAAQAFWIDQDFDREHAPDGISRYGGEVRERASEFAESWGDISPVTFAVTAWRLATALTPGYVRWHRRIVAATCLRSPWDGSLICDVSLVSPWPAELTWTRQWWRDRGWRDWPQLFGQYVPPSEQDLTRSPHLRACLLVQAPIPLDGLPPAPAGPQAEMPGRARLAISVLVRELNDLISPLIEQLEAGLPASS